MMLASYSLAITNYELAMATGCRGISGVWNGSLGVFTRARASGG
jgi:hypothetical protein